MSSVDVKWTFPNTPQRLRDKVWGQLGLLYGDFVEEYLRTRRYTIAPGKRGTECMCDPRWRGTTRRHGGPVPVHACHAPTDAMDSGGVPTPGATHIADTSIGGRCDAHGPGRRDEEGGTGPDAER